jgi:hypothetical protein
MNGFARSWSDLLLGGFAGVSLGSGRTHRTRGSCGPRRTCRSGRSRRSGKAAVFYHYFSLILPGADFDSSGGKLRSNPTEPSSRTALDLHCFGWADFDTHVVLARSPNPSDNCQLAAGYGSSRDKYFCTRISARCDHIRNRNSYNSADKVCEHGNPLAFCQNLITEAR